MIKSIHTIFLISLALLSFISCTEDIKLSLESAMNKSLEPGVDHYCDLPDTGQGASLNTAPTSGTCEVTQVGTGFFTTTRVTYTPFSADFTGVDNCSVGSFTVTYDYSSPKSPICDDDGTAFNN